MLLFACWHANPFCSNHGSALFSTLHAVLIAPFTKEFVVFSSQSRLEQENLPASQYKNTVNVSRYKINTFCSIQERDK